jgi:hypothetical protein
MADFGRDVVGAGPGEGETECRAKGLGRHRGPFGAGALMASSYEVEMFGRQGQGRDLTHHLGEHAKAKRRKGATKYEKPALVCMYKDAAAGIRRRGRMLGGIRYECSSDDDGDVAARGALLALFTLSHGTSWGPSLPSNRHGSFALW